MEYQLSKSVLLTVSLVLLVLTKNAVGVGFRTVGSSGVAVQMAALTPYTNTAVFIDKYHVNYGYPTVDLHTGKHATKPWHYPGTTEDVFGSSFNWRTNHIRALKPVDDTSCSIGAFLPDGTLINVAGGPADENSPVRPGFEYIRTFGPGPCPKSGCTQDWKERGQLSTKRWYSTAQTLVNGDILVVGGAKKGGLVLNEANINVPSYEIVSQSSLKSSKAVPLPILSFTAEQNLQPGFSYNMYPILHLLPNSGNANQIFTLAGNRSEIWDYGNQKKVKALPEFPKAARTFPSSSSTVLLPLTAPGYTPEVLVCGGSSNDMPNPLAMNDCYTIRPYDRRPKWSSTDNLPNGPQTLSNGILLPDGTVLILNGARVGCAGGKMADNPVFEPVIYNRTAPAGSRFTTQPSTSIARMYHSASLLLPSGEVLVAGSNPLVGYSASGNASSPGYPHFRNNGHEAALIKQQSLNSSYPTEYRVEIFSPPYIGKTRPVITEAPPTIHYGKAFTISATLLHKPVGGLVTVVLSHSGFSTHAQNQGQRMMEMNFKKDKGNKLVVTAPKNGSFMPKGVYLLWVVANGVPSVAEWISLQA